MDKQQSQCPTCGSTIKPRLLGLCPQCMLKAGLQTETAGGQRERFEPPSIEELRDCFPQLEIDSLIGRGGMARSTRRGRSSLGGRSP